MERLPENLDLPHLDKTRFSTGTLFDATDETAYWQARTPGERLLALEIMRRVLYGYDPSSLRLQRFFEIAERTPG